VQALVDAFFEGPVFSSRSPLPARDYVRVVVRALLWREPTAVELDLGEQFLGQAADRRTAERQLRNFVIRPDTPNVLSSDFVELITALFTSPTS
jgi:hypothetical protein